MSASSSSPSRPLRTAVAGIGGFGTAHHQALKQLEEQGEVKVVATCDPALPRLREVCEEKAFSERGVALYEAFEPMMEAWENQLDLVTVAAPIPLHAAMHRACVERGIACYMEKPPTLNFEELEEMIALDQEARVPTVVGFNYIYQPFRHELKRRILAGDFGAVKRIAYHGLWPRNLTYYGRNGWAGRLFTDSGTITLDSCCGNAMAHHVHNILFFGGIEGQHEWATPQEVEAELYRANAIQGTDTIFCRARMTNGVELRIAASHACFNEQQRSQEVIECEEATIEITPGDQSHITFRDGRTESFATPSATLADNLELYGQVIRGETSRPATLLSDSRGFVQLNGLFYLAAKQITTVKPPYNTEGEMNQAPIRLIDGINEATARMVATGEFPSEQGLPWAAAGGCASIDDLPKLRDCLTALAAQA